MAIPSIKQAVDLGFSLAWILSKKAVSSILVGANTLTQLKECVDASGHTLTADELREVDEIRKVLRGVVVVGP